MIKKELIGKIATVIDSKNKSNIGIKGVIRNETKHTLTIEKKVVFKKNVTIKIGDIIIKCEKLAVRPEERIKK